jgi:hypothetical protein
MGEHEDVWGRGTESVSESERVEVEEEQSWV